MLIKEFLELLKIVAVPFVSCTHFPLVWVAAGIHKAVKLFTYLQSGFVRKSCFS